MDELNKLIFINSERTNQLYRIKCELRQKDDTISIYKRKLEYFHNQVLKVQTNKIFNKFIDETFNFDFNSLADTVTIFKVTELFKEWCSFSENDCEYSDLLMKNLEEYMSERFPPTKCGREYPYYTVYYGLSIKV